MKKRKFTYEVGLSGSSAFIKYFDHFPLVCISASFQDRSLCVLWFTSSNLVLIRHATKETDFSNLIVAVKKEDTQNPSVFN